MSLSSHKASGRRTTLVVTALVLLAVGAGLWFWVLKPASHGAAAPAGMPPPPGAGGPGGHGGMSPITVSVVSAEQGAFPVVIRAVGNVTPYNTVTVVPQVEGRLLRVHFQEGAHVQAGQLLAELDPRALQASLDEARGTQAQNQAELKNARSDLTRYERLYRQDSVSRQQLETQRALVRQLQARSTTDQAKVDNARVQLGYTKIHAPVAGRLGLLKTNIGAMIGPSTTDGLVSIVQTDPISVIFGVPEVQLTALRDAMATAAGNGLAVEAWDRSEQGRLASGRLTTLDNQIDTTTGSLRVRARFDNPGETLFPNQFVNIRLTLQTLPRAVSVPVDAVQFGTQGNYVYVVRDDKAYVQVVKLGATTADRVQIVEGLAAGERVVLEGMDRLRNGSAVKIVAATEGDADALLAPGPGEGPVGGPPPGP